MNIIKDFFFTAWGKDKECPLYTESGDEFYQSLLSKSLDSFCDYATILMSISSTNVNNFLELEVTKETLLYFSEDRENDTFNIADIYYPQCRLLSFLMHKGDMRLNKSIGQRIEKFRKASIIGYDSSRKLISTLTLIKEKKDTPKEIILEADGAGTHFYKDKVLAMTRLSSDISRATEDLSLKQRADDVPLKIAKQKFSIGITGVMNAGKSTMLNALLGKEVLGTAVIPETANLTVIKYDDNPSAVVHFWNSAEWNRIVQSGEVLDSVGEFVTQTKEYFGEQFGEYVIDKGRSEAIKISQLPLYTSAEHSGKKCNLVKSVELYSDLEFVQNGVEIVDTPGLDDPVIQREEITTSYLVECDLLCHLMNVNQSATQKDIEFIIDSLLYRNVAQLLIVITRIDTVSKDELEEVVEYTKSSIRAKLESLGKGAQFDALVARIEFMPIAGLMALWHRVGRSQEAIDAGYDLQKSGILEVESYLRDVLFGKESIKAQLIIDASKKELINIADEQSKLYRQQESLLGKSSQEIEQEYKKHKQRAVETKQLMERLDSNISSSKSELEEYLGVLKHFIDNKLNSLKSLLKRRVMDDVSYELRKNKKKPSPERISTMIEIGMRDGFIDMLREYRYMFQKKIDEALEKTEREFDAFSIDAREDDDSAKELFIRHFDKLMVSSSYSILQKQINQSIAKVKKKEITTLDQEVESHLEDAMSRLEEAFTDRADVLNQELLEGFEARCRDPLESMHRSMESEGLVLQSAIEQARDSAYDTSSRLGELSSRIKQLQQIKITLENGEQT